LQQEATTSSDTSGSFITSNKESSLAKRQNDNGNWSQTFSSLHD
jgi:hypothetical protein